jgi:hypothetical protein
MRYTLREFLLNFTTPPLSPITIGNLTGYRYEMDGSTYFVFPTERYLYRIIIMPYATEFVTDQEQLWIASTLKIIPPEK